VKSNDSGAARISQRINHLATLSASTLGVTRHYLTPEHEAANQAVSRWMQEAGMRVSVDAVGNIVGCCEGASTNAGTLLIGSHLDSVPNGGRFDGVLGLVTAIECVELLHRSGITLSHPLKIIGFGDEEGTRFNSPFIGSRGFLGGLDPELLNLRDKEGISLAQAMTQFGLDPEKAVQASSHSEELECYLELHIEQGPVLENERLPVGIVSGINGQTRARILLTGVSGHAGTVPMAKRRDALAGAAQAILEIEGVCADLGDRGVVGTVGEIDPIPGAANVIAGICSLALDLRAPNDDDRQEALGVIRSRVERLAEQRDLNAEFRVIENRTAVSCSPRLTNLISRAVQALDIRPVSIGSGAGHDAMVMASATEVGMIFVRCRGGTSHNPEEFVTPEDMYAGLQALCRTLLLIDEETP
jgi:allantoate deiminase